MHPTQCTATTTRPSPDSTSYVFPHDRHRHLPAPPGTVDEGDLSRSPDALTALHGATHVLGGLPRHLGRDGLAALRVRAPDLPPGLVRPEREPVRVRHEPGVLPHAEQPVLARVHGVGPAGSRPARLD